MLWDASFYLSSVLGALEFKVAHYRFSEQQERLKAAKGSKGLEGPWKERSAYTRHNIRRKEHS